MGVLSMIEGAKAKFHQRRMDVLQHKTEKIQQENLKQAEITKKKQELREAQQIKEDLRAEQMKTVERAGPTRMQRFGKGLSKTIEKAKKQTKGFKGLSVGAPQSSGSKGLQMGGNGRDVFGGTSGLNTGGKGLQFGKAEAPKKPKSTTIIIKQ